MTRYYLVAVTDESGIGGPEIVNALENAGFKRDWPSGRPGHFAVAIAHHVKELIPSRFHTFCVEMKMPGETE